jgi:hypothetical protein
MINSLLSKREFKNEIKKVLCNFQHLNISHFLYNPIKLPCSNYICVDCLDNILKSKSEFMCNFCHDVHSNFVRNNLEFYKFENHPDKSLNNICYNFSNLLIDELNIEIFNGKFIFLF